MALSMMKLTSVSFEDVRHRRNEPRLRRQQRRVWLPLRSERREHKGKFRLLPRFNKGKIERNAEFNNVFIFSFISICFFCNLRPASAQLACALHRARTRLPALTTRRVWRLPSLLARTGGASPIRGCEYNEQAPRSHLLKSIKPDDFHSKKKKISHRSHKLNMWRWLYSVVCRLCDNFKPRFAFQQ
jgi:hypothetical protein